jgi:hypothetical protein
MYRILTKFIFRGEIILGDFKITYNTDFEVKIRIS